MQTMITFLDTHCTQEGGYEAYKEKLRQEVSNNFAFLNEWDEWCFVAYFSRKLDLTNIDPEFLMAISEVIRFNPGIFSILKRVIAHATYILNEVNLIMRLRDAADQTTINLGAVFAFWTLNKAFKLALINNEKLANYSETLHHLAEFASVQISARAKYILFFLQSGSPFLPQTNHPDNLKLLLRAAEQGYAPAQYILGYCYENDAINFSKVVWWYTKAAEQRYAPALSNLGACYGKVTGQPESRQSVLYIIEAALQGNARAQFNLGWCHQLGEGIHQNSLEAVRWFSKAAEQGFAEAQVGLALCYVSGEGIEKDFDQAVKWLRNAAAQRFVIAQYYLGFFYEDIKDFCQALDWYEQVINTERPEFFPELDKQYVINATEAIARLKLNPIAIQTSSFPSNVKDQSKKIWVDETSELELARTLQNFRASLLSALQVAGEKKICLMKNGLI
jgi:TPR repeat protein